MGGGSLNLVPILCLVWQLDKLRVRPTAVKLLILEIRYILIVLQVKFKLLILLILQ